MVQSFMPASLQEIWNASNVRGFMMLSLFLQMLLASTAYLRKASTSRFFLFVIWSAYFMADWAATFMFGLISNAQRIDSISPPEVDENLMAFWAAFLLIHLGGPDTITAYSLEDNALWMRHLVGLVAQLSTFFYIFFKTLLDNNLVAPTILIAVAGAIKYGERTRSLYPASMENLKKSTGKLPVTSLEALVADDEDQVKEIYEARESWILTKLGNSDGLMRYVNKFDYDRSLLAWHIATEICHNANRAVEAADHKQRKLAVKLSNYMHYLLIKKLEMMSAVAGICHIRHGDTCAEVEHFCRVYKAETVIDFCNKILNEDTTIEPADVYKDKFLASA